MSRLFTKTSKNAPADAETVNAKLLIQSGFVQQEMAGVYSYLPLGLRVLRKISDVVRQEINALGAEEILMPALHPKAPWVTTGAWDSVDVLFKIKSRTENEYALGQSEEEIVAPLVISRASSYKQYPLQVYQIGWKYRDELRAKSGILRGREFLMKDMYSFHTTQEDFDRFYQEAKVAYLKIYKRLGLNAKVTEASGGAFSTKISYEFMVPTTAGEDDVLYCEKCDYCINVEITDMQEGAACPREDGGKLVKARASEVGNVFDLGQRYGKAFEMGYTDEKGEKQYPIMGCYGIGISRVMGVIVEASHDERGMIWPKSVAPFVAHLVSLNSKDSETQSRITGQSQDLYDALKQQGVEVLWDDRDASPGEKLADADLIGCPLRILVSEKTLKEDSVEWKLRAEKEAKLVTLQDALEEIVAFVEEK